MCRIEPGMCAAHAWVRIREADLVLPHAEVQIPVLPAEGECARAVPAPNVDLCAVLIRNGIPDGRESGLRFGIMSAVPAPNVDHCDA